MKTGTLTITLVLALAIVMVFVTVLENEDENRKDENNPIAVNRFTNREVVVFSESDFADEVKNILTDSTQNVYNYDSKTPTDNDIALIDESWLTAGDEDKLSPAQVKNMIESNIPIIFVNGDSYLYKESGIELRAYTSAEDSLAYGMYYDSRGLPHLFVYRGDDLSEALTRAYKWADDCLKADSTSL